MRLDYGSQLSPDPIKLSIGTLRKPKLREIANITFNTFYSFEFWLTMTPEKFFAEIINDVSNEYLDSLSEEERKNIDLFDIVVSDQRLLDIYIEILNFFFQEHVIFRENMFVLLNPGSDNVDLSNLSEEDIQSVFSKNLFDQVINVIQQICCIDDKEEPVEDKKFKNKLAKELYEKMLKGNKERKKNKKGSVNFTLPNLISAVSNKHPTINPINVWDLTVFQLQDSFNRIRSNILFEIDSTRVSVWGDEKKTFDFTIWFKNEYDKK